MQHLRSAKPVGQLERASSFAFRELGPTICQDRIPRVSRGVRAFRDEDLGLVPWAGTNADRRSRSGINGSGPESAVGNGSGGFADAVATMLGASLSACLMQRLRPAKSVGQLEAASSLAFRGPRPSAADLPETPSASPPGPRERWVARHRPPQTP
jgi:hypothetical protein